MNMIIGYIVLAIGFISALASVGYAGLLFLRMSLSRGHSFPSQVEEFVRRHTSDAEKPKTCR